MQSKNALESGFEDEFVGFGEVAPSERPARPERSTANALERVGLPPPSAIPKLTRSVNSLTSLPIDPRSAFVATQIDGQTTVENILDLGTMPRSEALAALVRLVKLGVVVFA